MKLGTVLVTFVRINIINEAQYRVNFFLQLVQSALALVTGLVGLSLVFAYTTSLAGWSHAELLVVLGVYVLMGGIVRTVFQPNMERLMGDVQAGTLDYLLTKPADSQVIVSIREVRIWQAVDIVLGLGILGVAVSRLQIELGVAHVLTFILALLLGATTLYNVWLVLATCSFWFVRVSNIMDIFQSLYQTGRWPVSVYPTWLRLGLTFFVPVAFAVTVPAEALTSRLSLVGLLGAAAVALLSVVAARVLWRIGLRKYSGASA